MEDEQEESEGGESDAETSDHLFWIMIGVPVVVLGLLVTAGFVCWPIYRASHGAEVVSIYRWGIALGIGLVLLGINIPIFRENCTKFFPDGDTKLSDLPWQFWFAAVLNVGVMMWVYSAIEAHLESLGYR